MQNPLREILRFDILRTSISIISTAQNALLGAFSPSVILKTTAILFRDLTTMRSTNPIGEDSIMVIQAQHPDRMTRRRHTQSKNNNAGHSIFTEQSTYTTPCTLRRCRVLLFASQDANVPGRTNQSHVDVARKYHVYQMPQTRNYPRAFCRTAAASRKILASPSCIYVFT